MAIESEGMAPGGLSMNVVEGDAVVLVCRVKGDKDVSISWLLGGEVDAAEVLVPNDNLSVNLTYEDANTVSRLYIKSATFKDRAYYICNVNNRVVEAREHILVRVKGIAQRLQTEVLRA